MDIYHRLALRDFEKKLGQALRLLDVLPAQRTLLWGERMVF